MREPGGNAERHFLMRLLLLGVLVCGAAACTHADPPLRGGPAPAPTQAPPAGVPYDAASAPRWFVQRTALPTCGYVTLTNAKPRVPDSLLRCLAAASGGELGIGRYTDEGDEVVSYYRRAPGSSDTIVVTDSTRDRFGVKVWGREVCTGFSAATLMATACHPTDRT